MWSVEIDGVGSVFFQLNLIFFLIDGVWSGEIDGVGSVGIVGKGSARRRSWRRAVVNLGNSSARRCSWRRGCSRKTSCSMQR